jgi:hypothetical protein
VPASQGLYQAATEQINLAIREARLDLAQARAALEALETAFPTQEPLVLEVRREQVRTEVKRIAQGVQRRLPRLLTLTIVEKLGELWSEMEELGAPPEAFPLADVLTTQEAIAYIGSGDTARTLKELVDGNGPISAYPVGWQKRRRGGRATIYNEAADSPQMYATTTRRRYGDVFTDQTRGVPQKANRYRLATNRSGRTRIEVSYRDDAGTLHRNRYAYVFDATGLSRFPQETRLPSTFQMSEVLDLQGFAVARGDVQANLFIVGSATGDLAPALPRELQEIIDALGILENPLALWVNGLLAERLAYTYAARTTLTKTWPQRER